MAKRTRGCHVRACQRKARSGMIKGSVGPSHRVVAGRAHGRRILHGNVVWHRAAYTLRAVKVGDVAAGVVAIRDRQGVIVTGVALVAIGGCSGRSHLVIAGQSPARRGVAPRSRGKRRCRRVAVRAICKPKCRARCRVHRVIGAAVIGGVTVGVCAGGGRSGKVITTCGNGMALRALHGCSV